ncbi:MAG: phosphoribosylglycinamide formyltransferase [Candidatus Cloacimonetes bacterium]|nr:phosphoribosylglycinamide formyltransferase [Candidatus Cloacimonadota bacterium]MCF7812872.1 phosphoribosylglycinamide formyltransferase [Candidatus Cloacimonadota bacterium]MCF7867084.1 phosphoribosylglycinamide formyltransferase [Candidatus Cloacimonadota bacterium]MCF7882596.1 phosphoribosylglycinamide formyltransferase [Candidatus Cloacimonadota bacterium]
MNKIIIMISGRGSNMFAIAKNIQSGILKDVCEIQTVFSNKSEAPGLQKANEMGIRTHCIPSKGKKKKTYNSLLLKWLKSEKPDFIVLAGYMKVLPVEIIQEFPRKIINIHPADTTEHQGLHGYEWAWENNIKETKITVHFVDEGLDTGEIIRQRAVDLNGCNSLEEVEKRGLKVEHEFYSKCLREILTAKITKTQKVPL